MATMPSMESLAQKAGQTNKATCGNRLKIHKNIFLDFVCWSKRGKRTLSMCN